MATTKFDKYIFVKKSDYSTATEYSRNFKIFQRIRSIKPIQIYEILHRRTGQDTAKKNCKIVIIKNNLLITIAAISIKDAHYFFNFFQG